MNDMEVEALLGWVKHRPAVLELVRALMIVDAEPGNEGASAFWSGYLWSCLRKARDELAQAPDELARAGYRK